MSALGKRNHPLAGNDGVGVENGDLGGSRGIYSSPPAKASHAEIERRFRAHRSGKVTIGNCILAEKSKRHSHPFKRELLRQREIETLIKHRYGSSLPENDGDEFFRAIAHAIQAHGSERVYGVLCDWCHRWAPWALSEEYLPTLKEAAASVAERTNDLRADAVATLLCVTMSERLALGFRTVGACDVTPAERKQIMKEKKMESDRERRRVEREIARRKSRPEYEQNSLSKRQPWKDAGMSRAAWYRLPKHVRETGVSKVEYIGIGDTLVSGTSKASSPAAIAAPSSSKDSPQQSASVRKRRDAKQSEAEGRRERMRVSPAQVAAACAALDSLHQHNAAGGRWMSLPGSAMEMIAA